MSKYGQSANGQTDLQIQCMSIIQAESEDSAFLWGCNQSNAKRNKEDCRVVPPRNDDYSYADAVRYCLGPSNQSSSRGTKRSPFFLDQNPGRKLADS
jgi:hypothetical protein